MSPSFTTRRIRRAAVASALLIPALALTGAPGAPAVPPTGSMGSAGPAGGVDPGLAFSSLDIGADDPVTDRAARPAASAAPVVAAAVGRSPVRPAGHPPIGRNVDRPGSRDDRSQSTRPAGAPRSPARADMRGDVRTARAYTPRHAAEPSTEPSTSTSTGTAVAPVGAEVAVLYALAQVGKQYVFGSAGPNTFDCSGLVVAAFRAAGVTLPRTTGGMRSAGRRVGRAEMRRGDVLWFEGGGHVAIYLGGGRIVHAANERTDVRTDPVYETPVEIRRMIG